MEFQIGTLTDYKNFSEFVSKSDLTDLYKFSLGQQQTVSMFLSGLSAGTKIELLNNSGTLIESSINSGTNWTSSDSGKTGGLITKTLAAGNYQVRVSHVDQITGNPLYDQGDKYSLIFQPHDAAKTVAVAAANTSNKGGADILTDGSNDQVEINKAIEQVGKAGGGTVLLLGGTFNISGNIFVTYDNVTLAGVGWNSILKQANNVEFKYAGMLRSAFAATSDNIAKPRFVNQTLRHLNLDGNKKNQSSSKNAYGNFGCYESSTFEDMRVHDFASYGFDPHENSWVGKPTIKLTLKNNLADHNGQDGITIDNCEDSLFIGNISDANKRHGFNIVTASRRNTFSNNVATNNGSNGFTIQSGGELSRTSDNNSLTNNISKFNQGSGFYVYLAKNTQLIDNLSESNFQHGIRLRSATYSLVDSNDLLNNSQGGNGVYNEIYLDDDSSKYSRNNSVKNNTIINNKSIRAAYGIAEKNSKNDYNTYTGNFIQGTLKATKILGLNSKIS